jgi:DNA-directed RNA polymerase specialized sigma24 family protein
LEITSLNPLCSQDEKLHDNPDFNQALAKCLADLPPKWKIAVTYKYVTHKNAKKICQDLEISVSNNFQMVYRAKQLLKKCLEQNGFNLK